MPLDPQAQALIASLAGTKPVEEMTVQEMRDGMVERAQLTGGTPQPVDQVLSSEVPGPAGPIPVRIYVPEGPAPKPGLLVLHQHATPAKSGRFVLFSRASSSTDP